MLILTLYFKFKDLVAITLLMSSVADLMDFYEKIRKNNKIKKSDAKELENMSLKLLHQTNEKLRTCIGMFNLLIGEITNLLTREFPKDQSLHTYSKIIEEIVSTKPTDLISLFVINIYGNDQYRKYILDGNDKFFISHDHKSVTGDEKNKIQMMFQFKSYWGTLGESNKIYIKGVMKTLIEISEMYIGKKDDGNKIADLLKVI